MKRKSLVLGLACVLSAGAVLASCGGKDSGKGVYTYRTFASSTPTNFNPHTWEMSNDTDVAAYAEMGFVDIILNKATGGYDIVPELAEITDVSEDGKYADPTFIEKWGLKTDTDGNVLPGQIYGFNLNKDAKFASGRVINADEYIESMKLLLDPKMKNYRANTYCSGDSSLVGANDYFMSDSDGWVAAPSYDPTNTGYTLLDSENYYVSWEKCALFNFANFLGGMDPAAFSAKEKGGYAAYFSYPKGDGTTGNLYDDFPSGTKIDETFTAAVLASNLNLVLFEGSLEEGDDIYLCGAVKVHFAPASFDTVGLVKEGEYSFIYILNDPLSEFYFKTNMSGNIWLVNTELYKSLISDKTGIPATTYGTNVETYDSYGPYKLSYFEKDKQMKFEKNENWYGWTDGKHEGQFQTTNIDYQVIPDHATALLAFNSGELDGVDLEPADVPTYGLSDRGLFTPETYTMRYVFDSNLDDLKALEAKQGDGANKQVLANYNFRKAFSLAIDRARFNAEGTAGHEPAYGIMNKLYYYDVENNPNSVYRNTPEAKQAILDLYDIKWGTGEKYATLDEAYDAVTGYDSVAAKELFQKAYDECIADGTYTSNQKISLNIGVYDNTVSTAIAQNSLVQEFLTKATEGTGFEGKITVASKSFNGDETRYDAIGSGNIEIANCAWGGAAFYPFTTPEVYINSDEYDLNEQRSWDPTKTLLSITHDFGDGKGERTVEKSYYAWEALLSGAHDDEFQIGSNDRAADEKNMKNALYVLSRIEHGLLDQYLFAVVGSYASMSLYSYKIEYATTDYNIMYGYGGIRFMTYNYDDAAWAKFVKSNKGTLNYK